MGFSEEVTNSLQDVGAPVYKNVVPAEQLPPYLVWQETSPLEVTYTLDGIINPIPRNVSIQLWADQYQSKEKEQIGLKVMSVVNLGYESSEILLTQYAGQSDVFEELTGYSGIEFKAVYLSRN